MPETADHAATVAGRGDAGAAASDCDATSSVSTQLSDTPVSGSPVDSGSNVSAPNAVAADVEAPNAVTAVVLAGGTSRRFGDPDDDKLAARLGGHSVLDVTLANVPRAWPIVAVGPQPPRRTERAVAEDENVMMPRGARPANERHRHEPHRIEAQNAAPPPSAMPRSRNDAPFGGPAASPPHTTAPTHDSPPPNGPATLPPHVIAWVQDDPPFGGPVAAIAAALPRVTTPLCAVLAGDTPFGGLALPALTQAVGGHDGAQLMSGDRVQPLIAAYRTASLRAAIASLSQASGASMRALLASLDLVTIDLTHLVTNLDPKGATRAVAHDIDTVDDLAWFREHGIA